MKKLVSNMLYPRDSGFFTFIDIYFEIDIRKKVPHISFKRKLNRNKVFHIDKGGCRVFHDPLVSLNFEGFDP